MPFETSWLARIRQTVTAFPNQRVTLIRHLPNNLLDKNLTSSDPKKTAAVMIPLCNRHGVPSVLFTKRSETVGTHKGHVSFPGGHIDKGESAVDAALRECYEELGTNIGKVTILGECQTVPAITGTLVTPILGFLENDVEDLQHFSPNDAEVHEVFTRSVEQLVSPGFREEEWLGRDDQKFKFAVFDRHSPLKIWGLTAAILDAVLKNVIIPTQLSPEEKGY